MKILFEGRIFPDEIGLWQYIQTICEAPEGVANGHYVIELAWDIQKVFFRRELYFVTEEDRENFLCWVPPPNITFLVFEIVERVVITRHLYGIEILAIDRFENDRWGIGVYTDRLLEMSLEKSLLFDPQRAANCIGELVKLLMVKGKESK